MATEVAAVVAADEDRGTILVQSGTRFFEELGTDGKSTEQVYVRPQLCLRIKDIYSHYQPTGLQLTN